MKGGIIMAKWDSANCMGYALGINKWLRVGYFGTDSSPYEMAKWLIDTYGLKPVKRSEMVLGKVYIVFRLGYDDFHFARRSADGHWRHKPGWCHVRPISEKEVFGPAWTKNTCSYTSRPFLFELPSGKVQR